MRRIPLTQGKFALVDDADYPELSQYRWHAKRSGNGWYAQRNAPRVGRRAGQRCTIHMHRVVMTPPDNLSIDHANGNGLDNRRANLRICTHAENVRNSRRLHIGSSCYRGVTRNRKMGKWVAQIAIDKRKVYLGCFESELDAAWEYALAALVYFGAYTPISDVEFAGLVR